jgi:hypothetical protein
MFPLLAVSAANLKAITSKLIMNSIYIQFRKRNWLWAAFTGLCLCLAQVSYCLIFSPKDPVSAEKYFQMIPLEEWNNAPGENSLSTGYLRFNNWDSVRFFEIAQHGYHLPSRPLIEDDIHHYRANTTTPPGYPFFVRIIQDLLRINGQVALLVTAQLACVLGWTYFLLILLDFGLARKRALLGAITVAVYPSSFYMVVGYTESLLIASMLGFVYWTHRWLQKSGAQNWFLALAHGFLGTATRVAGFPLVAYPVAQLAGEVFGRRFAPRAKNRLSRPSDLKIGLALLLSGLSTFGLISFFVYCGVALGRWNAYFAVSKLQAQVPNYLAIFKLGSYLPRFFFETTVASINRCGVPCIVFLLGLSLYLDSQNHKRWGLYGSSVGLLYLAMAGRGDSNMDGMIRYTLPIFALMILVLFQVMHERKLADNVGFKLKCLLAFGYLLAFTTQGWLAYRFLHGKWVS